MTDKKDPGFEVRDGDLMVVRCPEVKIGLPNYSNIVFGGSMYTRRLAEGDDPVEQFDRIYAFLKRETERRGREAMKEVEAEVR